MTPDEILKSFNEWKETHPDLSPIEQVNEFSAEFNLTPEERFGLLETLGIQQEPPPKPLEPRPRGKILELFLNYARMNPGLQISQAVAYFAYYAKLSQDELRALNEDVAKIVVEQRRREEEERERKRREEEEKKRREEEEKKRREEEEKRRKEEEKKKKPTVKPELLIKRTPYPKWWKDSLNATINLTAPGDAILATVSGKLRLYVATIVITVTGETVITIAFGNAGTSGPIYLGGEGQPMGMVIAMGNSPAPCGNGSLSISATDPGDVTPLIGGFATCFAEEG